MTEEPDDYEGPWPKEDSMVTIENRAGVDVLVMNKGAQPATEGEVALFAEVVRLRAYVANLAAAPAAPVQQAEPISEEILDRACDAFEAADCPGDRGRGNLEIKLLAALAVLHPPPAEVQRLREAARGVCDRARASQWAVGEDALVPARRLDALLAALDALEGK